MTPLARAASAVLCALVIAACGGGAEESESTTDTNRALLGQTTEAGPSTPVVETPDLLSRVTNAYLPDLGYNRGSTAAPLKVIEFSDFGCGYCRRFHEESFPTIMTQFIETGMIEWKFLSFVSGSFENSLEITEAAECALEQSTAAYEQVGGQVWLRQSEWKESGDPEGLGRTWAQEAGVDIARWDSCMSEDRRISRIAGATATAQQLGVRGTPTFWLVGYGPIQGALPLEAFQGIFATLHAEITQGINGGPPAAMPPAPAPGAVN
jgi:protein-disulfide isomerase